MLRFNGTENNTVVTDNGFPDLTIPFSISLWVNPAPQQDEYADIFGNHGGQFSGFVLQNGARDSTAFGPGFGNGTQWQGCGPAELKPNTWQHVTVVYDSEHTVLYVDGIEKARGDSKGPFVPNRDLNFRLGQGFASARLFRGALSDVRVYTKALTPEEISALAKPVDGKK